MDRKLYFGENALAYMRENHPHVTHYSKSTGLFAAIQRKGLIVQRGVFDDRRQMCATKRVLDQFAEIWCGQGHNGGPKNNIVVSHSSLPRRSSRPKWKSLEEMIERFQGTGQARYVPPGIHSLKELNKS
jgi:hypothetical protein